MITGAVIISAVIIYLIIGAFVTSMFWQIVCDHEEEWCTTECWCGRSFGYIVKLIAYTGILAWLPALAVLLFVGFGELIRRLYGRKM